MKVIAPDADGVDQVLESQEEMVPAMAASNLAWQQQCMGTLSMTPSFVQNVEYLVDTPADLAVIEGTYKAPAGTDPYMVELLSCMEMTPAL